MCAVQRESWLSTIELNGDLALYVFKYGISNSFHPLRLLLTSPHFTPSKAAASDALREAVALL